LSGASTFQASPFPKSSDPKENVMLLYLRTNETGAKAIADNDYPDQTLLTDVESVANSEGLAVVRFTFLDEASIAHCELPESKGRQHREWLVPAATLHFANAIAFDWPAMRR
jgi:hypothetical protein